MDIDEQWAACERALEWSDFQLLQQRYGVPSSALAAGMAYGLGAARFKVKGGRWVADEAGERGYVLPAVSPVSGEVCDLVAFRPEAPRFFWAMTGDAPFLGYDALCRADYCQEPLTVFDSVLDWLRADCRGLAIVDWRHYWPLFLGNVATLRVHDVEFGCRLRSALQHPFPIPDIEVAV